LNWKPNKWVASILGFVLGPIGIVYAGFPILAAAIMLSLIVAVPLAVALPGLQTELGWAFVKLGFAVVTAGLCCLLAMRAPARVLRPWYTRWYGLIVALVVAGILVLGFRAFFYETFVTRSTSMSPVAEPGRVLLVQKRGFGRVNVFGLDFGNTGSRKMASRGDVVAFTPPNRPDQTWIKRVVGLSGDTITYRGRHLYVNGVDTRGPRRDAYLDPEALRYYDRYEERIGARTYDILLREEEATFPPEVFPFRDRCTFKASEMTCVVPPDHYFLLGDNRDNSMDSRMMGFSRSDAIIGIVINLAR
jgi:signal peptidase I